LDLELKVLSIIASRFCAFDLQVTSDSDFDPQWWVSRPNPNDFRLDATADDKGRSKLKDWFVANREKILERIKTLDV
jgi:hypothetical protein